MTPRTPDIENVTEILTRLVGFETITNGPNLDMIDWVQGFLSDAGFIVTRIPSSCGTKAGLLAKYGTGDGGVLYSAHSDVVPITGQNWSGDPFTLRQDGDRLIGRGTTDMKGFLACVLDRAQQLNSSPPDRPFMIALSWDEEIGCRGIPHMIDQVIPTLGRPDLVIVGEPTEMQLCIGHKGKASYKAICTGEAGHSALAPQFKNALHDAAKAITALQDVQADVAKHGHRDEAYDVAYSTIHAGKMTGGVALNIVPEHAEIDFEIRFLAADDPEQILRQIAAKAPEGIRLEKQNAYPGLMADPSSDMCKHVVQLLDVKTPMKVTFGTEAGFFAELGFDTVVCGPGSMTADGHQPDEGLAIEQLGKCVQFIRRLS
ncbi:MAG: acetylornithine deacetylase [Paracoccaceae bacterium]